jgi:carbamoylphosphate synthase large subunit
MDFLGKANKVHIVRDIINKHRIDIVIVTDPVMGFLSDELKYDVAYIGPSTHVSNMETDKIQAMEFVASCGVSVPKLLGRYRSDEFDSYAWSKPLVIKPSRRWSPAIICYKGEDQGLREALAKEYPHEIFLQEYIDTTWETSINYTIIGSEYLITVIKHDGNIERNYGVQSRDWYTDVYMTDLEPVREQIVRTAGEKILSKLSKLYPGNHEGTITGFLIDDNWYFGEFNIRRSMHNSIPSFLSGDDWLRAMQGDMVSYSNVWNDVRLIQVVIHTTSEYAESERYPVELHDRYPEIHLPAGLKSDYTTSSGGVIIATQSEFRDQMDKFITELESSTRFTANRPY